MSGLTMIKPSAKITAPSIVTITPEKAMELLEANKINRPLQDQHVKRITRQIIEGKWRFNGDTIKISDTGDVLDGQHRLWAVIEAKKPIETILVYGIHKDAFSTIDTLRKPRSGSDVIALTGTTRHRNHISGALQWMLRWQRGVLLTYLAPQNKIENSDIEEAFHKHRGIVQAIERGVQLRLLVNPSIISMFYYVLNNRNPELSERMMMTLENPAGVAVGDPFFRLRSYFTADHWKRKDPVVTIALCIKAANAAYSGKLIQTLTWKNQGQRIEDFPELVVK